MGKGGVYNNTAISHKFRIAENNQTLTTIEMIRKFTVIRY